MIVLTAQRDPSFAAEALRLGAAGYLPKEAAEGQLLEAIRVAAGGGTYLEPQLGARLAASGRATPPELTDRELEVLRLIARGQTNREVAERLFLSVQDGGDPSRAASAQAGPLAQVGPRRVRARARPRGGVGAADLAVAALAPPPRGRSATILGAAARLRRDRQLAVQQLDALAHAAMPKPSVSRAGSKPRPSSLTRMRIEPSRRVDLHHRPARASACRAALLRHSCTSR